MERIEILQGTNPTIAVRLRDVNLVGTFVQNVDGEDVVRHSYFTIRHSDSSFRPISEEKGEVQVEMQESALDTAWSTEDEYGNIFTINNSLSDDKGPYSIAKIELSRTYTRLLHDHDYYFQFNLIERQGEEGAYAYCMFAVDEKPLVLRVKTNLADLRSSDEND